MAENVIRQDVIEVTTKSDTSGLDKLNREMNKMQKSILGFNVDSPLQKVKQGFQGIKSAMANVGSFNQTAKMESDINRFDAGMSKVKAKVNGFKSTLASLKADPIKFIGDKLLGVEMAAGRTAMAFKRLVSTKWSNMKDGISNIKNTLTQGETGAKGLGTALKNIGKISVVKVADGFGKIKDGLKHTATAAKTCFSALSKINDVAFDKLKNGINKVASGLSKVLATAAKLSVAAIGAGTAAVGAFIKKGISYNNQMQSFTTSFETLLGGAEKADAMVKDLKGFADKTPFEMPELAQSAQTMLGFGVSAEKVMPYMQALGDVSQGNAERFGALSLAFSQVQAAGKLTGQDLLQMINAGFNPLQTMSEKTGKSIAQLKEEMSKGAISADMVADAFKNATSEGGRFYQSMEKQSKTFSGQMSTIKDNAMSLLGGMTKGLQENLAKNFLPQISGALGELQKAFSSGGMDGFIKALPEQLNKIIPALTEMLSNGLPQIINIVVSMLSALADALISALPQILPTLAQGVVQLMVGLGQVIIRNIPALLSAAKQVALSVVSTLYTTFTGQPMGEDAFNKISQAFDNVINAIFNGVQQIGTIIQALIPIFVFVGNIILNVVSFIANNLSSIIPIFLGVVVAITILKAATIGWKIACGIAYAAQLVLTMATTAGGIAAKAAAVGVFAKAAAEGTGATATGAAAVAQWGLNSAVLAFLAPVLLVVAGIAAVVAIFVVLYKKCAWVRKAIDAIGDAFKWVGEKIGKFFKWVGGLFGKKTEDAGKDAGENLKNGFNNGSNGIEKIAKENGIGINQSFADGINSSSYMPENALDGLNGKMEQKIMTSKDLLSQFGSGESNLNLNANLSVSAAGGVKDKIMDAYGMSSEEIKALGFNADKWYAEGLQAHEVLPQIKAAQAKQKAQEAFRMDKLQLANYGLDAPTAIAQGMTEGEVAIIAAASRAKEAGQSELQFDAQTWLTLQKANANGMNIAALGIDMGQSPMTQAANRIKEIVPNVLMPLGSVLFGHGAAGTAGYANGINSNLPLVNTAAMNTSAQMNTAWERIQNAGTLAGAGSMANVAAGIINGSASAISAAGGLASSVEEAGKADIPVSVNMDTAGITNASGAIQTFKTSTTTDFQNVSTSVDGSMQQMNAGVDTGCQKIQSTFTNTLTSIQSAANSINLFSSGFNIMWGLMAGMESMRSRVVATAQSIANSISSTISSALKEHSPSRVTFESGVNVDKGAINGMEYMKPQVAKTAFDVGDTTAQSMDAGMYNYGNYTPSDSGYYYANTSSSETNTYAPQFSVNVYGGSGDDKTLARKVKRMVQEGIEETFDSMNRRRPRLREV